VIVSDTRRLRIYRVTVTDGELSLQQGSECWQDQDGAILSTGLWSDLLASQPEDLAAQAKVKNISSLEWLRRKLEMSTYLRVEVV